MTTPSLALTDSLGWAVVVAFLGGQGIDALGRERESRYVTSGAWVLFAVFWLALIPTFLLGMRSVVEGVLSILAVPLCLLAAHAVFRGRDDVALLSRAVGVMGVVYLSAVTVPVVRRVLVETVASQTATAMRALGFEFTGPQRSGVNGLDGEFVFTDETGHRYRNYVVVACTGIGAISIFAGIVAAVRAPLARKLRALAVVVGIVWLLNLARTTFIMLAFGRQWFQSSLTVDLAYFVGYTDPALASYFVADRVISQSLSLVAVVGIAAVLVRLLPETTTVFEATLRVLTGREVTLDPDLVSAGSAKQRPDD